MSGTPSTPFTTTAAAASTPKAKGQRLPPRPSASALEPILKGISTDLLSYAFDPLGRQVDNDEDRQLGITNHHHQRLRIFAQKQQQVINFQSYLITPTLHCKLGTDAITVQSEYDRFTRVFRKCCFLYRNTRVGPFACDADLFLSIFDLLMRERRVLTPQYVPMGDQRGFTAAVTQKIAENMELTASATNAMQLRVETVLSELCVVQAEGAQTQICKRRPRSVTGKQRRPRQPSSEARAPAEVVDSDSDEMDAFLNLPSVGGKHAVWKPKLREMAHKSAMSALCVPVAQFRTQPNGVVCTPITPDEEEARLTACLDKAVCGFLGRRKFGKYVTRGTILVVLHFIQQHRGTLSDRVCIEASRWTVPAATSLQRHFAAKGRSYSNHDLGPEAVEQKWAGQRKATDDLSPPSRRGPISVAVPSLATCQRLVLQVFQYFTIWGDDQTLHLEQRQAKAHRVEAPEAGMVVTLDKKQVHADVAVSVQRVKDLEEHLERMNRTIARLEEGLRDVQHQLSFARGEVTFYRGECEKMKRGHAE